MMISKKHSSLHAHLMEYARQSSIAESFSHVSVKHIMAKVQNSVVESEPFPHLVIDDFLPEGLFARAEFSWPDSQLFAEVDLGEGKSAGYVGTRKAILISDWPRTTDLPEVGTPWKRVANTLQSAELSECLFSYFAEQTNKGLEKVDQNQNSFPGYRAYLCRDKGLGDGLGAHIDALRKILTVVLYVSLRGETNAESSRNWGTTLYSKSASKITPLSFEPNSKYVPARQIEFRPNRAFIMPNSPVSLHGVVGGQHSVERRTAMFGYWLFDNETMDKT